MYPVPNDEGDGAFEGLFHLELAVAVVGRGRLGPVGTRRLEKWLGIHEWSGCGECMDAVDLDGHWLDMAVSVDGDNERADLLSVYCFADPGHHRLPPPRDRPTRPGRTLPPARLRREALTRRGASRYGDMPLG